MISLAALYMHKYTCIPIVTKSHVPLSTPCATVPGANLRPRFFQGVSFLYGVLGFRA